MRVKLLKNHGSFKEGDVQEVDAQRGNYLIRCGIAKEEKGKQETKELKVDYETKAKTKKKRATKHKGNK